MCGARLQPFGVTANSLSPGFIPNTGHAQSTTTDPDDPDKSEACRTLISFALSSGRPLKKARPVRSLCHVRAAVSVTGGMDVDCESRFSVLDFGAFMAQRG